MNLLPSVRVKYLLSLIILLISSEIRCQPAEIDLIVKKIYNQEFGDIQTEIDSLRKDSNDIAQYLEVDYLWWKMISEGNSVSETEFLSELDLLKSQYSENDSVNFAKLFYLIYQVRYENLKKHDISKYIALIKFHLYLDHFRNSEIKVQNSFVKSIFELIDLSELNLKYMLLIDNGLNSKQNIKRYEICLARLENLKNSDYTSFEIIKQYYLGKIYLDVEKNYNKALNKFEILSKTCPNNLIFKNIIEDCQKKVNLNQVLGTQSETRSLQNPHYLRDIESHPLAKN
jgi:hypothetical protein